jgi:hypothetical protein
MKLITCGDDDVRILDAATGETHWSLAVQDSPDLSEDERAWVGWYSSKTDECKPLDGGERILVTSVSGLVCVVTPETGRLIQLAWVPGAHSAEQITEHLFAAAVSLHPSVPPGAPELEANCIALFDIRRPGEELWRDECRSAHGVVWERQTETLWTLGLEDIRSYVLGADASSMDRTGTYPLPDPNGHDLAPVPDERALQVSTGKHVFRFDMETGTFEKHPSLGDCPSVKSISVHPETGEVAYVPADAGKVKSDTIRFVGKTHTIARAGAYKARWLC